MTESTTTATPMSPTTATHEITRQPHGWGTCRCCPDVTTSRCACGEWFCGPHANEHRAGHQPR